MWLRLAPAVRPGQATAGACGIDGEDPGRATRIAAYTRRRRCPPAARQGGRMIRRIAGVLLVVSIGLLILVFAAGTGRFGTRPDAGVITGPAIDPAFIAAKEASVRDGAAAVAVPAPKQILFGDLHVHSTYSFDAFTLALPMSGGEGAHPVADACDFARHCSSLDFFSINDHDLTLTPRRWDETIESIRQCNAIAGDGANPDLVTYLGWEWTQVGATPETHYGHKNVVLRGLADDEIPPRPISAGAPLGVEDVGAVLPNPMFMGAYGLYDQPPSISTRRCTSMHFEENQLSRGLISLSLLPSAHPRTSQGSPVRPFTRCYPRCSLAKGRSPPLRV